MGCIECSTIDAGVALFGVADTSAFVK